MKTSEPSRIPAIFLAACCAILGSAMPASVAAELMAKPWKRGAGPADTSTWIGSNYLPAYASNQIQMWHEFRPDVIEKELAAGRRHFGITSVRVLLHNMLYDADKDAFLQRIEQFLVICERNGIRPGLIFFDDCWARKGVTLEPQAALKGRHNSRSAAVQDAERNEASFPKFKAYVQDIVRAYRDDPRVLFWEVYNEPNKGVAFSETLRERAYGWAMECKPVQPVLACWDENPFTEIVNVHKYSDVGGWDSHVDMNPAKGAVVTEAGARWMAPWKTSSGEPCEAIEWVEQRKAQGKSVPGVYLCWELMIGNSNCRWLQGLPEGAPETTIPWCGLLWPDGSPYSLAEAEAIRHYATGERRALLYENFQSPAPKLPEAWREIGSNEKSAQAGFLPRSRSGVCIVPPGRDLVAGEAGWSNYVMEAVVMLKDHQGEAGLVLRMNNPDSAQAQGYYIGFDTQYLKLMKLQDGAKELKKFDHLAGLECKVFPGVWNQLRVAVDGNRIRVWFNRMHPTADPANGLRIDFVDKENPVLSGSVGLRAVYGEAWFDNVVVMPTSVLK